MPRSVKNGQVEVSKETLARLKAVAKARGMTTRIVVEMALDPWLRSEEVALEKIEADAFHDSGRALIAREYPQD